MTKNRKSHLVSSPGAERRRHSLNPSSPFGREAKPQTTSGEGTPKLSSSAKKDVSDLKRPRQEDQQSPNQSLEARDTQSVKMKKLRAEKLVSSPDTANRRHSLTPSSPFEGEAKSQKTNSDGTPKLSSSAKKDVGKLKRPRQEDQQSPNQSLEAQDIQSVKMKKLRAEKKPTRENSSVVDDPGQKLLLLGMIRQRLVSLNARTLFVRKLPRSTLVGHLKSVCPTSVNGRLQPNTNVRRRKNAFVVFKTEQAAREALHSVNGKLIADKPVSAHLCSERSSYSAAETSGKSSSWSTPDQVQLKKFHPKRLHISCIPRSATPEEIKQLFPRAVSLRFDESSGKQMPWACEAKFSTEAEALSAFTTQHGSLLRGCPIIVNFLFKSHKPKRHALTGCRRQTVIAPQKTDHSRQTNQSEICAVTKLDGKPPHKQSQVATTPHTDADNVAKHVKLEEITKHSQPMAKSTVKSELDPSLDHKNGVVNQTRNVNKLKKTKVHPKKPKIKQIRLL